MNNAFTKDHDYSKFRLRNCEIDNIEHSNAVENDIPIDPTVFDLFEGKSVDSSTLPNPEDSISIAPNNWIDNDEEISSDNTTVTGITTSLDNAILEMKNEEKLPSYSTPRTDKALDAIKR